MRPVGGFGANKVDFWGIVSPASATATTTLACTAVVIAASAAFGQLADAIAGMLVAG
jgi:hypothetical protein